MKKNTIICALIASLSFGTAAQAACYADYKAKKTAPLKLHYGVVQLPGNLCGHRTKIRNNVAKRISRGGWTLLNVMSVFGPEGLMQRQQSAGPYYLRF